MKKALIASLCFILIGFAMAGSTYALPDLDSVFANLVELLGETLGLPELGGTTVDVEIVTDTASGLLSPGGAASRKVSVRNQGSSGVYFRFACAVQYHADSWEKLTIRFDADDSYLESDWMAIDVDDKPYRMKVFTYQSELPAGADAPQITMHIAMDRSMTSAQMNRYSSDFVRMQVLAIEPKEFTQRNLTTAQQALDAALPLSTLNPF